VGLLLGHEADVAVRHLEPPTLASANTPPQGELFLTTTSGVECSWLDKRDKG